MNLQLLQWGLFSFLVGLTISIPLAAVYYIKSSILLQIFSRPRKLLSAHLDFIMQAFALGLVYLLEFGTKTQFPEYIVIPLVYGSICNPLILLLESTALYESGVMKYFYKFLKGTSPFSLLVAWFTIAFQFLSGFFILLFCSVLVLSLLIVFVNKNKWKKKTK